MGSRKEVTMRKFAFLVVLVAFSGCCAPAVYVSEGKAVRLAQDITAKVAVTDDKGTERIVRMTLPTGWYCAYIPQTEIDKK